jgi:hypothetical protein
MDVKCIKLKMAVSEKSVKKYGGCSSLRPVK